MGDGEAGARGGGVSLKGRMGMGIRAEMSFGMVGLRGAGWWGRSDVLTRGWGRSIWVGSDQARITVGRASWTE